MERKESGEAMGGGEKERLIPTAYCPEMVSPQNPEPPQKKNYSLYLESDALIHQPRDVSPNTACGANRLLKNFTRNNNSFSIPDDLDSYSKSPQINLCFPSPEFSRSRPVSTSSKESNTKKQDDLCSGNSPDNNASDSSNVDDSRMHGSEEVIDGNDKPDDSKSQSRLSASPDFWRRVSPQLVYIDSSSFGGGSCRSGSVNSACSYTRGRSTERTLDNDSTSKSKNKNDDSVNRDDTRSVNSAPILDCEKSVSWKLTSVEGDETEKETKSLRSERKGHLRKQSTIEDDLITASDSQQDIQRVCNAESNKSAHERFLERLKRSLSTLRNNINSSVGVTNEKSSVKQDNSSENSLKKQENIQNDLDRTKAMFAIVECHNIAVTEKSPGISLDTKESLKEKDMLGGDLVTKDPNDEDDRNVDSITELKTNFSGPSRPPRGQLRRYFSLDSSPMTRKTITATASRRGGSRITYNRNNELRRSLGRHAHQQPGSGEHGGNGDESRRGSMYPQYSQYYMEKDLRYYFQHPWFRLFVAYLVIFCNFLLFAEDPLSHSHTESNINVVGNVFSFVATKYPTEWYWKLVKVVMWVLAVLCGMLVGKVLIHGLVCQKVFRLKMFRDEQGSWMCMFLTVIVSMYMFSYVYNLLLLIAHPHHVRWKITSAMGVTNASMMKAAATCTWLGDLVTALMVTDMMLQDRLYPHWGTKFRHLYNLSNIPRILIFWVGSIVVSVVVIFLIVSDYISWNKLNKGFVETTELSRAFLASFILVMDLLIVMQDWDFPHFTSTIDVNLPGFSTHTLHWRWAKLSFTGKWFNYGIIFMVMILDLNMWKNQLFYTPQDYGQYIDPVSRKVYMLEDEAVLNTGNKTLWTWQARSMVHPHTGKMLRETDPFMYSRWMGYSIPVKCTAFIPNLLGMAMFFTLITLYGRFPPNQDGTYGGRLKKRQRSSWRRERSVCEHYCDENSSDYSPSLFQDHEPSQFGSSLCPSCKARKASLTTVQGRSARSCYLSRCATSQPDFGDILLSDPKELLKDDFKGSTSNVFIENEEQRKSLEPLKASPKKETSEALEANNARVQKQSNTPFKDIRVIEDSSIDPAFVDDNELQRHFTEILTEKDRKQSRTETWNEAAEDNSDSEASSVHEEPNYKERLSALWKEKYASRFKFNFSIRQVAVECPVDDSYPPGKIDEDVVMSERRIEPNDEAMFDSILAADKPRTKPVRLKTSHRTYSDAAMCRRPRTNSKRHKRLSSAEANLIEPVKLKIEGIRFFRRRKKATDSSLSDEENPKTTLDESVRSGEVPEFKITCDVGDAKVLSESSDAEKNMEEGVQFVMHAASPPKEEDGRSSCERRSSDQEDSDDPFHRINFGSNVSVNL